MTTEAWTSLKVGICYGTSLVSGTGAVIIADTSQAYTQWLPVFIIGVITAATPGFMGWLKTRETHKLVNSRLDEFKKLMIESEFAKGKMAGQKEEQAQTVVIIAAKAAGALEEKEKEKPQ